MSCISEKIVGCHGWFSCILLKHGRRKINVCIKTQHKFMITTDSVPFRFDEIFEWFLFWLFFFKIFVGTNTALMLGLGTGEKTRKKKVKKLSSLFAFGFSSFLYSVIKFIKLNLVKFLAKRTDCCQAMIKLSSKEWISLRLHLFFYQINFWMMNWIICTL